MRLPRPRTTRSVGVALAVVLAAAVPAVAADDHFPAREGPALVAFRELSRASTWEVVDRLALGFDTFHPQGLAVVGDRIFLSSVEILEPTVRHPDPVDGYDRTPGKGVGHLFVLDPAGNLLHDVVLGEGDVYHPGGIDVADGEVWVPVGEYRPGSASIIYRVDVASLEVEEAFRVDDHVGGVVVDASTGHVHGVSWGSRTFYEWTPGGHELSSMANGSHFVDHQDCQYVPAGRMLCGGVAGVTSPAGDPVELGGLTLLDLADGRVVHEVPVQAPSTAGHVVTRNPVHLDEDAEGLRLWAAPDDGEEGVGTELLTLRPR